jgi:hypothetical protein
MYLYICVCVCVIVNVIYYAAGAALMTDILLINSLHSMVHISRPLIYVVGLTKCMYIAGYYTRRRKVCEN